MASEPRNARWKRTSRTLGQGGQAQVVVVVDSTGTLQGEYALKVLSNVQRTPRLDLEINTTKSLSQLGAPVLPIVDDYIVSEPDALHPWYVSPVADGGDLGKGEKTLSLELTYYPQLPTLDPPAFPQPSRDWQGSSVMAVGSQPKARACLWRKSREP